MSEHQTTNTEEPNSQDGTSWKKYHAELVSKMSVERLREAMRIGDRAKLEHTLAESKAGGMTDNDPDVKKAQKLLHIMETKQKLYEAVQTKDYNIIFKEVDAIKEGIYYGSLQNEVREAEHFGEVLERQQHKEVTSVLNMDKKTMSEIRRYCNPPEVLKKVMQGALLLLGEDEASTANWQDVRRICNPQGQTGLNRRIMEFDHSKVHPEISARAQEILSVYDLHDIQSVSAGGCTFYVWAMGVLEETNGHSAPEGQDGEVTPADVNRQREILGKFSLRPPPDSPRRRRKINYGYNRSTGNKEKQKTEKDKEENAEKSPEQTPRSPWKT